MKDLSPITRFRLSMAFYGLEALKKTEKELTKAERNKADASVISQLQTMKEDLTNSISNWISGLLGFVVEFKGIKRLKITHIIAPYYNYKTAVESLKDYNESDLSNLSDIEKKYIDLLFEEKNLSIEAINKAIKDFEIYISK